MYTKHQKALGIIFLMGTCILVVIKTNFGSIVHRIQGVLRLLKHIIYQQNPQSQYILTKNSNKIPHAHNCAYSEDTKMNKEVLGLVLTILHSHRGRKGLKRPANKQDNYSCDKR